jgi:hypothetical protein
VVDVVPVDGVDARSEKKSEVTSVNDNAVSKLDVDPSTRTSTRYVHPVGSIPGPSVAGRTIENDPDVSRTARYESGGNTSPSGPVIVTARVNET